MFRRIANLWRPRPTMTPQQILEQVGQLVDAWCERRALKPLRHVLAGFPLSNGLTDDWAGLLTALQNVRAFCRDVVTNHELATLDRCCSAIERLVYR